MNWGSRGVELKDELWIEPKGLWSKAEGVWWRPVMLEYASRTTESNCCSVLSWQWRAYRHTPPSAIPGTRAKQPNSNFGIPKGKQSLKKQAKSANAAFLVVHKTIIAKRSAEEFKVSEGDGCQWHVKWSGWTPPTPATTHLEGLPQGQALSPVWIWTMDFPMEANNFARNWVVFFWGFSIVLTTCSSFSGSNCLPRGDEGGYFSATGCILICLHIIGIRHVLRCEVLHWQFLTLNAVKKSHAISLKLAGLHKKLLSRNGLVTLKILIPWKTYLHKKRQAQVHNEFYIANLKYTPKKLLDFFVYVLNMEEIFGMRKNVWKYIILIKNKIKPGKQYFNEK